MHQLSLCIYLCLFLHSEKSRKRERRKALCLIAAKQPNKLMPYTRCMFLIGRVLCSVDIERERKETTQNTIFIHQFVIINIIIIEFDRIYVIYATASNSLALVVHFRWDR